MVLLTDLTIRPTFDQAKKKKTSLKAFSHQRRAKPFNTLRSKADSSSLIKFMFREIENKTAIVILFANVATFYSKIF